MTDKTTNSKPLRSRCVAFMVGASAIGLVAAGAAFPFVGAHWVSPAIAEAQSPNDFSGIVERVKPAVVGVRASVTRDADDDDEAGAPGSSPFQKPFRGFGDNPGAPRPQASINQGSGFFISSDGYIVTTNHVVDGSHRIEVATDDEKSHTARLIGADARTDIALLKVDDGQDFPFVQLAKTTPKIGEWVLAVGNPFGLGGTVTAGIVSARARDIKAGTYNDFLQIDAPVNQGNSGGPTFNLRGDVIGVNSAIFSPSGGSIGIGFAIPADTVDGVVTKLKEGGVIQRGWIGVRIQRLTDEIAEGLGARGASGALVIESELSGPAAKAGIAPGDIIKSVDGRTLKDERDLMKTVGEMAPGTAARLSVIHRGDAKDLTITLGELPAAGKGDGSQARAAPPPSDPSHLGLELAPADKLGAAGVVVTDVDPSGTGAARGFEKGDLILDIGSVAIKTPEDVQKALADARERGLRFATARVKSGETIGFVAIPVG